MLSSHGKQNKRHRAGMHAYGWDIGSHHVDYDQVNQAFHAVVRLPASRGPTAGEGLNTDGATRCYMARIHDTPTIQYSTAQAMAPRQFPFHWAEAE